MPGEDSELGNGVVRRSWRQTVAPVLVLCASLVGMTLFVMWPMSIEFSAGGETYGSYMTTYGASVLNDLGSGLAVVAAIQFGVLIAIVGGQIAARSRVDEANLRTALRTLATLPVLALTPAVTLAAAAAFRVAEHRGAMIVLLPVFLMQLTMSVFISTFEVGDRAALRAFAATRLMRARSRRHMLAGRPRCSVYRAVGVTLSLCGLIAAVPIGVAILAGNAPTEPIGETYVGLLAVLGLGAPMSIVLLVVTNLSLKPAVDPVGIVFAGLMFVLAAVMTALAAVAAWLLWWPLGAGLALSFLAIMAVSVQSWREAVAVRAGERFTGYAWWAGGLVMQAGTHLALEAVNADLTVAKRQLRQYRAKGV